MLSSQVTPDQIESVIQSLNVDEKLQSSLRNKLSHFSEEELKEFERTIKNQGLTDPLLPTHRNSNQVKWNIYTFILINELKNYFLSNNHFDLVKILELLAKERHEIAQDMQHGQNEEERNEFGLFRGIETSSEGTCAELLKETDVLFAKFFSASKDKISSLIQENFLFPVTRDMLDHQTLSMIYQYYRSFLLNKRKKWSSSKLFFNDEDMWFLATTNEESNDVIDILVVYPSVQNKDNNVKKRLENLQPLFKGIFEIDPSTNLDLFLEKLGELSYHLLRMLFVRRGGAGMTDVLIRAIAESKNVILGPRSGNNKLPHDFEAFFTKNPAQYANWFKKHAFETVTVVQSPKRKIMATELSEIGFFASTHTATDEKKSNENVQTANLPNTSTSYLSSATLFTTIANVASNAPSESIVIVNNNLNNKN